MIENILLFVSVLILLSVIASKFSHRFAVPALLLFLSIGMLAGSEGLGGVYFDSPQLAKSIGVIALIFILFSGGIDTNWKDIRPVIVPGILLSTLGVLITAFAVGFSAVYILKFQLVEGLLLGAIVSSTDAAAVFNILRSKKIALKKPLKPLLEFESGSNDPMAVFLTIVFINIIKTGDISFSGLILKFVIDMGGGLLVGFIAAKLALIFIKRLKLEHEGLYSVLTIAIVLFTYSIASLSKCNGFLAVYVAGLLIGKQEFQNKKTVVRFHDGFAWLMQIAMFLTLGLLVFPSRILPVMGVSLLLSIVLIFVARPLSTLICLLPFKMTNAKKIMISWVGLRGAVPIILATFPLLAGIPQAETIFNVVFFVVLTSVLIQGTSIPVVSRLLKVNAPFDFKRNYPIEFEKTEGMDADLTDLIVPYNSWAAGKRIMDLNTPEKCLIMLISRNEKFIIPAGPTLIEGGDVLLVLASKEDLAVFQKILGSVEK